MTGKKTALTAFHNPLGIHPLTPFDTPCPHWQDVVYCSIPITILHIFFSAAQPSVLTFISDSPSSPTLFPHQFYHFSALHNVGYYM